MPTLEELRQTRIQKLENIRNENKNPYPLQIKRDCQIKEVIDKFWLWRLIKKDLYLVGRIKTQRIHGRASFFDLEDGSGKIQCFLSPADLADKKSYDEFISDYDIGDFVEIRGSVFKTKKGEKTIRLKEIRIISKSLQPLPEKWHGLVDIEERYRKRYLDLLMNKEVREKFLKRSKIIKEIRNFFDKNGFDEFETPMLQTIPGGATARPFKTHLNALDLDLYLRIAPELYLKRLLIGGFEKIYEIGRDFRNEGMDATHNPEFTMLEAYVTYKDSHYLEYFIQELFEYLVKKLNNGNLVIKYENNPIDFSKPWKQKDYDKLIKEYGNFDIAKKNLIQPTFVVGFPAELLPLSKVLEKNNDKADAFQVFAGGLELIKAFTEQNDPLEQRRRFEEQEKLRAEGEEEAQRLDEDFLESLEYGMPPCAGFGLGIDRLAMLLTSSHTAREIILFPTMRPKEREELHVL
ncbi:MAG: lysine--tRNA ligase [Candidatus Azambacteria bacterium]|nr:lysine--tRNA ligase [Candidatus Azambacteria bacterium]